MTKIVIIGAGSGFGGRLSTDILANERLRDGEIWLCDLHPGRLEKVHGYVQRTVEKYDLPTKIHATTDRCEALAGADFVITSISVGGGAYYGHPYSAEVRIPQEYGVEQTVADTVSVGAVFRFLRTAPVHLQILRDVERLAPNALVLNHTNPMAMLTWIHHAATSVRNVGLCHGVQGTHHELAKLLASSRARSTISAPASTTWPGSSAWSTRARTSTPVCARSPTTPRRSRARRSASRSCDTSGTSRPRATGTTRSTCPTSCGRRN